MVHKTKKKLDVDDFGGSLYVYSSDGGKIYPWSRWNQRSFLHSGYSKGISVWYFDWSPTIIETSLPQVSSISRCSFSLSRMVASLSRIWSSTEYSCRLVSYFVLSFFAPGDLVLRSEDIDSLSYSKIVCTMRSWEKYINRFINTHEFLRIQFSGWYLLCDWTWWFGAVRCAHRSNKTQYFVPCYFPFPKKWYETPSVVELKLMEDTRSISAARQYHKNVEIKHFAHFFVSNIKQNNHSH